MPDELQARWAELVAAVTTEFEAHHQGYPELDHDFSGLRLRARRRGTGSAGEWFEAIIPAAEVLERPPRQLAREFYQAYYACT